MAKPNSNLTREEKLAHKLRENLKRRKMQNKKRAHDISTEGSKK